MAVFAGYLHPRRSACILIPFAWIPICKGFKSHVSLVQVLVAMAGYYIILQVFSFSIFLCKFQVISQAEQEQTELEVKTIKHEIFKVTFSQYIILN